MRLLWNLTLVSLCLWASGCGTKAPVTESVDPVKEKTAASSADLKKRLEEVAASGTSGSGLIGIKESIDQAVRPSNAKLADELTKEFDLLSQTSEPAEIKTIATRMAGKL